MMKNFFVLLNSVAATAVFRDASTQPFIPYGFYASALNREQFAPTYPLSESANAMTLVAPYWSVLDPDEEWHKNVTDYLDLSLASGVYVHFALNAYQAEECSDEGEHNSLLHCLTLSDV